MTSLEHAGKAFEAAPIMPKPVRWQLLYCKVLVEELVTCNVAGLQCEDLELRKGTRTAPCS